jgi:hypothetical protein
VPRHETRRLQRAVLSPLRRAGHHQVALMFASHSNQLLDLPSRRLMREDRHRRQSTSSSQSSSSLSSSESDQTEDSSDDENYIHRVDRKAHKARKQLEQEMRNAANRVCHLFNSRVAYHVSLQCPHCATLLHPDATTCHACRYNLLFGSGPAFETVEAPEPAQAAPQVGCLIYKTTV